NVQPWIVGRAHAGAVGSVAGEADLGRLLAALGVAGCRQGRRMGAEAERSEGLYDEFEFRHHSLAPPQFFEKQTSLRNASRGGSAAAVRVLRGGGGVYCGKPQNGEKLDLDQVSGGWRRRGLDLDAMLPSAGAGARPS